MEEITLAILVVSSAMIRNGRVVFSNEIPFFLQSPSIESALPPFLSSFAPTLKSLLLEDSKSLTSGLDRKISKMPPMTKGESGNVRTHVEFVGQAWSSLGARGWYVQLSLSSRGLRWDVIERGLCSEWRLNQMVPEDPSSLGHSHSYLLICLWALETGCSLPH